MPAAAWSDICPKTLCPDGVPNFRMPESVKCRKIIYAQENSVKVNTENIIIKEKRATYTVADVQYIYQDFFSAWSE